MNEEELMNFVRKKVSKYYWQEDKNCATTVLYVLSEVFKITLGSQTVDAALAMHGAGKHGAQCGLVEGAIMFMGIWARQNQIDDHVAIAACREFAEKFEVRFGSLLCKVLRPEGFSRDNPLHICEHITCQATVFAVSHITNSLKNASTVSPNSITPGNGKNLKTSMLDRTKERSMHDTLTCREASKADLPGVLRLYAQPGIDDGKVLPLNEAKEIFERITCNPDYHIYVAVHGEKIIGTFALLIMENLGHLGATSAVIEDVAVDPEWQGCGVGKMMMRFALQKCNDKSCYKAVLSSNLKRDKAHAFYESIGFERHGYSFRVSAQPDTKTGVGTWSPLLLDKSLNRFTD